MGSVCGTLAPLGFITALKSASRSVSESPRTWTIWCPAGGGPAPGGCAAPPGAPDTAPGGCGAACCGAGGCAACGGCCGWGCPGSMAETGPPGASSRGSAAQSARGRPRMPRATARPAVPGSSYPSAGTGETAPTARRCPEPGPARPAPPSRRRKLTRATLQTKVRSYARPNRSRRPTPPLLSPPAPYPTETALRRAALLLAPARTASRPPGAAEHGEPSGPPPLTARGSQSPRGRARPAGTAPLSARPPAPSPFCRPPALPGRGGAPPTTTFISP